MGTFIGHAVPGLFFIIAGMWWTIQFAYHQIGLDNGRQMPRSKLLRKLQKLPIEGSLILAAGIIGFIGEQSYPAPKWKLWGTNGTFVHPNEWQHVTMYTYFSMYGVAKVLGSTILPAAVYYEKPFGCLAYFIEGLLFFYHVHAREELDTHLHILLVWAIWLCCFSAFLEIVRPKEKLFFLMRVAFTLLQGTWFWQVGFVLYWPPGGVEWDQDDHRNLMFTTVSFTWHLFIDIIIMITLYSSVGMVLRVTGLSAHKYSKMSLQEGEEMEVKLLGNHENGQESGSDN